MEDAKVKLLPKEMNKGVQILLERMTSHPEEFVPSLGGDYPNKWKQLLRKVDARMNDVRGKGLNADLHTPALSFLSDEEVNALHNKLQSIRGDLFTKEVMSTLLADDSDSRELSSLFSGNSLSATKNITGPSRRSKTRCKPRLVSSSR